MQMAVVDWGKWQTTVASFARETCHNSYKVMAAASACSHALMLSCPAFPVLHPQGARLPPGWIGFETIIVGEVRGTQHAPCSQHLQTCLPHLSVPASGRGTLIPNRCL